ncbi:hypothetical protein B296_00023919 [Ensete ventricosum]|uniref:EF-hand domain-containing protein n=1 Tax=Ensete ventricosum TaxID=4639 RepID=A0A427AS76_ENSVE|nr:hypothetical protein B296_00023919 [Ensete ventricosum]
MSDYGRYPAPNYAPSAPPMPDSYSAGRPPPEGYAHPPPPEGYAHPTPPASYSYPYPSPWASGAGGAGGSYFPPGTPPEVIRSFQAVDRDRSGFIEESELQAALSSANHKFSIRTVRLLMFLFKNPNKPSKMGEFFESLESDKKFSFLRPESCRICSHGTESFWLLGIESFLQSKVIDMGGLRGRFDRDRSGKIDSVELKDALMSLGYAVPPSVIQVLISNYTDVYGRGALNFDNFVE